MVPRRIEPKPLAIRGMRKPRQWMPIALLEHCERPFDRLPVQAGGNMPILNYIDIIIVIDEGVSLHWVVKGKRGSDKQETNQKFLPAWRGKQACSGAGLELFSRTYTNRGHLSPDQIISEAFSAFALIAAGRFGHWEL